MTKRVFQSAATPSCCAALSFCLYLFCLAPTVTVTGDSGELISASYLGGVAHPTGYPLYSILARIFAFLPVGEIAWRYNLFSALCGAATVGVVATIIRRLTFESDDNSAQGTFWAPLLGSLLLGGQIFFGSQCLIAEVYALNALLCAAIIALAIYLKQEKKCSALLLLAFLLGLSFNSHLSVAFVWVGMLVFLGPRKSSFSRPLFTRRLLGLAFAALLGFALTLYLPLRSRTFPEPVREVISGKEFSWYEPMDWGHPVDFARWKTHVTAGQYDGLLLKPAVYNIGRFQIQAKKFAQTPQEALGQFANLCNLLAMQFLWSFPLISVGVFTSFRLKQMPTRLGVSLLSVAAVNIFIAVHYDVDNVFDIANFLFPTYLVLAIWIGLGFQSLWSATSVLSRIRVLSVAILLAAVACQWTLFVQAASYRGKTQVRDLALERAQAAEVLFQQAQKPPQLLLATDDTLFPFWYIQKVLGHAPQAQTPWGQPLREYSRSGRLPDLVARLQKKGPVAVAQWDVKVDQRFPLVPITSTGSLWQATDRRLPLAAGMPVVAGVTRLAQQQVRRNELVSLNYFFKTPGFAVQTPLALHFKERAMHIGFVEVLVAPQGVLSRTPEPTVEAKLPVWKQQRRLVVPNEPIAGAPLHSTLPVQFPIELHPGEYELWTRSVRSTRDKSTPWTRGESFQIVVR